MNKESKRVKPLMDQQICTAPSSDALLELFDDLENWRFALIEHFGHSLAERAVKRIQRGRVRQALQYLWNVPGYSDLGDRYENYEVRQNDEGRDLWWCNCERFRRQTCSHLLAVWLKREIVQIEAIVQEWVA